MLRMELFKDHSQRRPLFVRVRKVRTGSADSGMINVEKQATKTQGRVPRFLHNLAMSPSECCAPYAIRVVIGAKKIPEVCKMFGHFVFLWRGEIVWFLEPHNVADYFVLRDFLFTSLNGCEESITIEGHHFQVPKQGS